MKSSPLFAAMVVIVLASPLVGAQAERPVPFKPGEVLTYDVSWTNYLTAGSATLSVKERRSMGGTRAAYYVVAEAQPTSLLQKVYRLYYKAESFLDTRTLTPMQSSVYSDERGRTRLKTTRFLPGGQIDYEVKTASVTKAQSKVEPLSQDPLGAIYMLRTLPLREKLAFTMPIVDGGKPHKMRVVVGVREPVKSGIGTVSAWRIDSTISEDGAPASSAQKLVLWVSDDARRLPLKLQGALSVGSFVLTLSKVQ